jgi:hypothetical protein
LQVLSFVAENERTKKMMLKQAAEACNMPVGTFYDKARKFENITKIKRINNWGKCTFAKVHFIKIQKEGMGSALMKNWERVPEVQ